jgi:chaperone modulatory protein CbpM
MTSHLLYIYQGPLLDEHSTLTLAELSRGCAMHAEWVMELVDEGILDPSGKGPADWQFSGDSLPRARLVARLQQDLGVNLPGAALAMDLLERIEKLQARLQTLQP